MTLPKPVETVPEAVGDVVSELNKKEPDRKWALEVVSMAALTYGRASVPYFVQAGNRHGITKEEIERVFDQVGPLPEPAPLLERADAVLAQVGQGGVVATAPLGAPATEALTYVPGLVGDLTEWIVGSARRPNRWLAVSAAISIIGTLAGKRIAGPTRSATHLYIVALAGTAAGKQHSIDCIKEALTVAGARDHIGPGDFTSSRAIVNFVKRQPLSLCVMDEFGAFLRKVNHNTAGPFVAEVTGELRKLWGICWNRYDSAETASVTSQSIESPSLSLYGVSTPEDFYSALKSEDVGNGFLNRFVIVETGKRGPEQTLRPGAEKMPATLEAGLKKLFKPPPWNVPILAASQNGPQLTLAWGPGGQAVYDALSRELDNESDAQRAALRSRVPEIAVRLATIRAVGRGVQAVDAADMEWGRDLALHSAEMLCVGVAEFMVVKFEFSEICPEIVSRMRAKGGSMSHRDILRSFQRHVKAGKDIHGALNHLLQSEQIKSTSSKSSKGGRVQVVYRIVE